MRLDRSLGAFGVSALLTLSAGCSSDDSGVAGDRGGAGGGSGNGSGGSGAATGGTSGASGGDAGGAGGSGAVGPPTIARIGETLDVPTLAESAPKRFADIAHHGTEDVYLVVTGSSAISGALVSGDGEPLGAPVSFAMTNAWAQGPRVARGGGKFLVAWHDNRTDPNQPGLYGRIAAVNQGTLELALTDFAIGAPPTRAEAPPGIAWSETSKLFLVVWQAVVNTDLRARRVDAYGSLVGDEIVLTSDPDWQSDPAVAWNSAENEFVVVWAHAGASAATRARRIDAASGVPLGDEIDLGSGTHIPSVVYEPDLNRYLVGWWDGAAVARVLGADGALAAPRFELAPGFGSYDGLAIARQSNTGKIAAVLHGQSAEDVAVAFTSSGETSAVIEATESPASIGNFNPRVAENPLRQEWMLVTSRGFETIAIQRLGPG